MKIYRVKFYYQYEGYIEFLCEDFYTKKKGAKEQHDKNVKQLNDEFPYGEEYIEELNEMRRWHRDPHGWTKAKS